MRPSLPVERLRRALRAWDLADADLVEIVPGATADVFLVLLHDERWVAKLAHDSHEHFEVGLRA